MIPTFQMKQTNKNWKDTSQEMATLWQTHLQLTTRPKLPPNGLGEQPQK